MCANATRSIKNACTESLSHYVLGKISRKTVDTVEKSVYVPTYNAAYLRSLYVADNVNVNLLSAQTLCRRKEVRIVCGRFPPLFFIFSVRVTWRKCHSGNTGAFRGGSGRDVAIRIASDYVLNGRNEK